MKHFFERQATATRSGPVVAETPATRRGDLIPLFFFGTLLVLFSAAMYFFGMLFSIVRLLLELGEPYRTWNEAIIWYSGIPCTLGVILAALDLAFLLPAKRMSLRRKPPEPVFDRHVVVALTAYNDEHSIGQAVADFRDHPQVRRVIVVDKQQPGPDLRYRNPRRGGRDYRDYAGLRKVCLSLFPGSAGGGICRLDCAVRGGHDFPRQGPREVARLH